MKKAGKRARPLLQRSQKMAARLVRSRNETARKEQQRILQLVISGFVFVLLVAGKLLFPDRILQIGEPVSRALENNMDVTLVFSAIGRAFSGEDTVRDSLGNVYQAVFQPQAAEADDSTTGGEISDNGTENDSVPPASGTHLKQNDSSFVYSDENLPDNVQLRQVVLGFDYCSPVRGTITSEFGYRGSPAEKDDRFHYGIDLVSHSGTAIGAFADGVVSVVGESSSYGKYLIITHIDGCSTLYAHCSSIHVSSGQTVSMGETVAEMGDTGQATGVHLHFEIQQDGVYLNPVYYVVI